MKKEYVIENVGTFVVEQNSITGSFSVKKDGVQLIKTSRTSFTYQTEDGTEDRVVISGSAFKGLYVTIDGQVNTFSNPVPWYGYLLSVIPFVMTMILGNMTSLVQAGFYYVGGFIGGGISGVFVALSLYANTLLPKWWQRVLASLLCIALTFAICYGIGNAIVASAK